MATFQLTESEFVRGSLAITWKRRTKIMYLLAVVLFMYALKQRGSPAVVAVGAPVVGIVTIFGLVRLWVCQRLKRIFRETASLQEPMHVVIDDQQLSYSFSRGSYTLPWANVRQWKETNDFFLIFESSLYGRMLPKRALSEEEVAIIRRNVASKPRRA